MNAPLDAGESPAAGGSVRRYVPTDRAWVAELIGGTAAIDARGNHIEIVEDGDDKAVAVWHSPEDGGVAFLGPVLTTHPGRRDLFNAAIVAVCEAGLAEGYTSGETRVLDRRIVRLLEQDFDVTFTPVGRNVKTGRTSHWELTVDLAAIVAAAQRKGFA